jgi:hypothetical protein
VVDLVNYLGTSNSMELDNMRSRSLADHSSTQYLLSFMSIVTEYTTHMGIICAYLSQTPVANCSQRGSRRFSVAVPHHQLMSPR